MLGGISAQMEEVKSDIGAAKKDLSEKIEKGNEATRELKERMDHNDQTFAERVTAVVASLPGFGGMAGPAAPVFSSDGQSSFARSYASCASSSGGSSSFSAGPVPLPGRQRRTCTGIAGKA